MTIWLLSIYLDVFGKFVQKIDDFFLELLYNPATHRYCRRVSSNFLRNDAESFNTRRGDVWALRQWERKLLKCKFN